MEREVSIAGLQQFLIHLTFVACKDAESQSVAFRIFEYAFPLAKPEPRGLPADPPDRFRFVYEQALADGANEVQAIGVAVESVQPSEDVEDQP